VKYYIPSHPGRTLIGLESEFEKKPNKKEGDDGAVESSNTLEKVPLVIEV